VKPLIYTVNIMNI